jgi:hypothetical protein
MRKATIKENQKNSPITQLNRFIASYHEDLVVWQAKRAELVAVLPNK